MYWRKHFFLLALPFVLLVGSQGQASDDTAAPSGDLTVVMDGLRNQNGTVVLTIYDKKQSYDQFDPQNVPASIIMKVREKAPSITLHDLPEGDYAIVIFHDENDDGDFNMSGGIPTEGYGVSNANDRFDDLSFQDASIRVTASGTKAPVTIFYVN